MPEDKSWRSVEAPDAIHVLPNNDVMEHKMSEHCSCVPVVEKFIRTCWPHRKAMLTLHIIHDAMDGRPD